MIELKKLPDAEFEIMNIIWSYNTQVTSNDIASSISDKSWKIPTIISMLKRLESKGFVTSAKKGKERYFSAIVSRDDYLRFETHLFVSKHHNGSVLSFVSNLIKNNDITLNEIEILKKELNEKKDKE
jgi:predicted transcriptional regulator